VTNPGRSPVVVLALQVGDHAEQRTLATDSTAGASYDVRWTLAAPGVTPTSPAALTLPARLGTIVATTGYGATVRAASKPAARQVISYRIEGAVAELLLPTQPAIAGLPNGVPGWIEVDSLPELRVRATRSG
jgi:hypothetical protein